jgi:AcrR family transcriptional regulator
MPRPPLARERVLDAYESLLIADGERAATLEAVAAAAGVSKGGLLYHFHSKAALAAGLAQRLSELTDADLQRMRDAPEGPVAYYVRTSVMEDDALDRALVASTRLVQAGSHAAAQAISDVRRRWAAEIRPHVRDDTALELVMLLGDGLYFNNSLSSPGGAGEEFVPTGAALDELILLVLNATARALEDPEPAPRSSGLRPR